MENLKQISYYNNLFDYYQNLLTEKQKSYFIMYFHKDYSLAEIADYYNISRNAVYDLIKKAIKKLEEYETKLKLYQRKKKRITYIESYLSTNDKEWLNKVLEMDDE